MTINAIVTIPPYAPFIDEVAGHPIVSGLRLNTVMPVKESLEDLLSRLRDSARGKDLWVDLKCRQLRVATFGVPPFTEIELTHTISVDVPVTAYFCDGDEHATLVGVQGKKLIMLDGPRRVVGPGESVNIPHPSLSVDGYLTDTDKKYVEAGQKAGIDRYMLSFVEKQDDIASFRALAPDATAAAKIESRRGLDYVRTGWKKDARLMTARGDLYVELRWPHEIVRAEETIVQADPAAIAASRILTSLAAGPEPSCADIGDVDSLLRMGYRTLMLGDDVCLRRESVISALNVLDAMAEQYGRRPA